MGVGQVAGVPGLTPRMAAAAMAMAVARREPNHYLAAFASRSGFNTRNWWDAEMAPLDITARDSIADAVRKTQALPFGGTDCALPMLDALNRGIPVDCFVVLTDSETWAGAIHPRDALRRYREETGPASQAGGGGHGVQRVQHRRPRGRRDAGRGGFRRRRSAANSRLRRSVASVREWRGKLLVPA